MDIIFASHRNRIYAFDFNNNCYYRDYSYKKVLARMKYEEKYPTLAAFIKTAIVFNNTVFTICKGPYNKRNLKKHIELCYPEYLL
jgi:hypothetical protein